MARFLRNFVLTVLLALMAGAGIVLCISPDPLYKIQEWVFPRFHRYDSLIEQMGRKHQVDPLLLKAVIWRESTFQAGMLGKNGERGLMQVTVGAANDWAKANKIAPPKPSDLFDAKTNIDAGTWYLSQALQRYGTKDDPIPFALAEYNAGRRRVNRWIGDTNLGNQATADNLRENISFPGTRKYVQSIMDRYQFYKKRGRM
jgi:soluble lytic murein transglycosylase